jgi:hypothetical protein
MHFNSRSILGILPESASCHVGSSAMNGRLSNVNIVSQRLLPTPREIKSQYPLTDECQQFIGASRAGLERILDGQDRSPLPGGRSLLDPRCGRDDGVRRAAANPGRRSPRHVAAGHARLLLQTTNNRRLEGVHQRSLPGRFVPHRRRLAESSPIAAGAGRHAIAGGDRDA